MRRDLITSALAILVFTVLFGLVYPLATTGISQVVFPNKADGSQIERDGKVGRLEADRRRTSSKRPALLPVAPLGHRLQPRRHLLQQPRPEPARTCATCSAKNLAAYLERERPYNPGLTAGDVPVDAVTTSASGVDPHISEANARIQARRVAEVRRLPVARVNDLIDENTDGRRLGFLGEPGVNVLELNLALDRESA